MKKLFTLVSLISLTAYSQNNPKTLPIQLSWGVIENNYQNKGEFLSAFTILNKGENDFSASGWKIYFNLPRIIQSNSVSPGMQITHLNGDFYSMSPTKDFKGLKKGESIKVSFLAGAWAINFTDAPSGVYFVWDHTPATGITISDYKLIPPTQPKQFMRTASDKIEMSTPALVYEKNKSITDIPEKDLVKVFPTPLSYMPNTGSFQLTSGTSISADAVFKNEAMYLSDELAKLIGKKLSLTPVAKNKTIELKKNNLSDQVYELVVSPEKITISAGSNSGIFYGIQSLKTLIPPQSWKAIQSSVEIPSVEVSDAPRFANRIFMLDVARNFQTKKEVMRVLDLLSLYKINVFHFHFSEDEGWRLEIPGLPELTEVGARRGHSLDNSKFLQPAFGSGPDFKSSGSGYYTKQDFIEIIKYAHARHIRVIPEIETPGHARAAVVSMRARYNKFISKGMKAEAMQYMLQDPDDRSQYRSVQGWNDNVMDVSLPSTYRFLEKVTNEIMAMYKAAKVPLETIHFGGDEVPAGVWEKSPSALALMKKKNMKSTNDLWYYYYQKIYDMLAKRSMYLYGWEEMALRKTLLNGQPVMIPNPDFAGRNVHTDVWNNVIGWGQEDLAYQLANAGFKVVLSPVTNNYFDMAYEKSFDEPGYYWGGWVDADKPFYFIPYNYYKNTNFDNSGNQLDPAFYNNKEKLTDYGKENIWGLQALLWGENLTKPETLEYLLLPKLLGFSERTWSQDPQWTNENDQSKFNDVYLKDWNRFVNLAGKRELQRLDYYNGGYNYRIPGAGAVVKEGKVYVNWQLPGLIARYTTDGKDPDISSPIYTQPISQKGKIKISLFSKSGRKGKLVEIENN